MLEAQAKLARFLSHYQRGLLKHFRKPRRVFEQLSNC